MASCTACGATLTTSSRFCSSCGAPVKAESRPELARASVRVGKGHVDPLASTAPASPSPLRRSSASDASSEASVSPKAETGFEIQRAPAPRTRAKRGQTATLGQPPGTSALGARVLVQWANGQKYAGVVEQLAGLQCLVRFETGERRWVESRYVLPT